MATASTSNGTARAQALAPYFDIQLCFASRLTALGVMPYAEALTRFTNLHRRFAYGNIGKTGIDPRWFEFVDAISQCEQESERLTCVIAWYAACNPEKPPSAEYGCFNFDPPDTEGVVRIHFNPVDTRFNTGPLHHDKLADRRRELRTMVAHVRQNFPAAVRMRGISWLYNLEAYRRIFPAEYAGSGQIAKRGIRYEGMSNWGQFLDHRGGVKDTLVAEFRERLDDLDPEALWRAFPLPALRVEAPLDVFSDDT